MILFIKWKSYPNIPDPVWKSNCPLTLTVNATPSNNNGKPAFAITGYEVFKMYLGEIWPTHISRISGWRRFGVILVGWPLLGRNDLHPTPYQPTYMGFKMAPLWPTETSSASSVSPFPTAAHTCRKTNSSNAVRQCPHFTSKTAWKKEHI